ncbi:MAG TPA: hypothetical protein VJU78_05345 [Chitinophagaceae bacterium]|nr:hypothetical protein [Chitinophagaceae bacterium]
MLLAFLCLPVHLLAQKKDTLRLTCLLNNAIEHQEKQAVNMGPKELKLILSSTTDTVIKACTDAVISTIQRDEEGKWDVVFNKKDYWFWLTGVSKVIVKKDQKIKTGDTIGIIQPGEKIELLLYDFETPLDPKKYMNCGQ